MRLALFYFLIVLGLGADLWSKSLVFQKLGFDTETWLRDHEIQQSLIDHIDVIPGFLSWESGINTGISWSILQGHNSIFIFIMFAATLIIAGIAHCMEKRHVILYAAMGFIVAGAMGNLTDRLIYDGVRDFIRIDLFPFPLFNVADSWITIGAVLIIIYLLFEHRFDPQLLPAKEEESSSESQDGKAAPAVEPVNTSNS